MKNKKQLKSILQKSAAQLLRKLKSTRYGAIANKKPVCQKDQYTGYYCTITKGNPFIGLPEYLLWIDNSTGDTRIWAGFRFSGKTKQVKFARDTRQALEVMNTHVYGAKEWVNGRWNTDVKLLTRPFLEAHLAHSEYYFGQYDSAIIDRLADAASAVDMAMQLLDGVFLVLQAQAFVTENNGGDDGVVQKAARDIRRGQRKFRKKLLAAYGGKCAISGCSIETLLDAAHVKPYSKRGDNSPANGILLRTDLHTLFDEQMLRVNPDTLHVELAPELCQSEYKVFDNAAVRSPIYPNAAISVTNLRERYAAAMPSKKKT